MAWVKIVGGYFLICDNCGYRTGSMFARDNGGKAIMPWDRRSKNIPFIDTTRMPQGWTKEPDGSTICYWCSAGVERKTGLRE